MAICSTCSIEFTPHRPRKFTKATLLIENRRLKAEGISGKEIKKRIEEEHETWRCSKCHEEIKQLAKIKKWRRKRAHHEEKQREKEQNARIYNLEESTTEIKTQLSQHDTKLTNLTKQTRVNIYAKEIKKELETLKEEQEQGEIERLKTENIYGWTTKHKIGWLIFLILVPVSIYHLRKYNKKLKRKKSKNLREEIKDKFNLWRLNMNLSVVVYVVSFFLLKNAIDKLLRPNIHRWLKSNENITVLAVTGILGFIFIADGYISSELKTPLQRLSVKIESANINEKEKKFLLSKTQQSNETFKETLKRFGLLSIAGIAIKLLGKAFDENILSLTCYALPILFGILQILRTDWKIKKLKQIKF